MSWLLIFLALNSIQVLGNNLSQTANSSTIILDSNASKSSSTRKPRVTILMHGQMARPRCGDKAGQWATAEAQHRSLFTPLTQRGFDVHLLVATNHCDNLKSSSSSNELSWESLIRRHYSPVLKGLFLDNCDSELDKRCLIHRVLLLWDRQRSEKENKHDWVLFARPDIVFKDRGAELILRMFPESENRIMWPYKCEPVAWRNWRCVVDTLMAIPAGSFSAYRSTCLGYEACYPESHQKTKLNILRFDKGGGYLYSGHACYRCVELAQRHYNDSRLAETSYSTVNATDISTKLPLIPPRDDLVFFGMNLIGDDFGAFNLINHPIYASAITAATHVADNSSAEVPLENDGAVTQDVAIQWEPGAAVVACKASCKEAIGCRAWSAGENALALESRDLACAQNDVLRKNADNAEDNSVLKSEIPAVVESSATMKFVAKLKNLGASEHGPICVLKLDNKPVTPPATGSGYPNYGQSKLSYNHCGDASPQVVSGVMGTSSTSSRNFIDLSKLRLDFAFDAQMSANARSRAGENPYYTLMSRTGQ